MSKMTMYDYLEGQPQVLEEMINRRVDLTKKFVSLYKEVKPTHIYLVGSGTSFNALQIVSPFMEYWLDLEVKLMVSSNLTAIRGERPMIIFLSQGGSSTNTLEAMEELKDYPYITITGEAKCEIQKRSKRHMLIGCDEELVGPKTIGYTASILNLYLCVVETGYQLSKMSSEDYIGILRTLEESFLLMNENIEQAKVWFEKNMEDMKGISKYVLVGEGITAKALVEGCLKILETIKVPAMSFEFEEYLHGPILFTDETLGGFFFISEKAGSKQRMLELAYSHGEYSKYAYIITEDDTVQGDKVLHIKRTGKAYTEVFESVIVPQLLAARLPEVMGILEGALIYDTYTKKCPTKYNDGR